MIPMPHERRQVKRYPIELDIDLILEDGTILPVKTIDISQHGLQFKCDGMVANEIEPGGIQSRRLNHIKMKVIARLPVDTEKKFYASCRIITARRLSQEEYLLGLKFFDFEKDSEKTIQDYIDKLADKELG